MQTLRHQWIASPLHMSEIKVLPKDNGEYGIIREVVMDDEPTPDDLKYIQFESEEYGRRRLEFLNREP